MSFAAIGIGAGTTLIGAGMSAYGANKQAKAEASSAKNQEKFYNEQQKLIGQFVALAQQVGPQQAAVMMKARVSPDEWNKLVGVKAANPNFTAQQQARVDAIKQRLALPDRNDSRAFLGRRVSNSGISQGERATLEAELASLTREAGGQTGQTGLIDYDAFLKQGPGVLERMGTLADAAEAGGQEELGRFDADTFALGTLSKDIEAQARRFGKQRTERVKRDSAESLENANAAATAALMGRGLGASTALTDALAGNTRDNRRTTEDALGSIEDSQIGLTTGLMGNRLGLLGSRAAGRTALSSGVRDQATGMRQGALNAESAFTQGPLANPAFNANPASFYPSVSPSAQMFGSLGSSLGGLGSYTLGYGMKKASQPQDDFDWTRFNANAWGQVPG